MKTKTLLLTVALLISSTSAIEKDSNGDDLLHKTTQSQLNEDGTFIKDEAQNVVYNKNEADDRDIHNKYNKDKESSLMSASDGGQQKLKYRGTLDNMAMCEAHNVCQSSCCIEPYGKRGNKKGKGGKKGGRGGKDRDGRGLQEEETTAEEEEVNDPELEDEAEDGDADWDMKKDRRGKRPSRDGNKGPGGKGGMGGTRGRGDKVYDRDGKKGDDDKVRDGKKGGKGKGWQSLKNSDWEAGDRLCMPAEYCQYYGPGGSGKATAAVPILIMLCMCFGVCGQRYYYSKKIKEAQDDQRVPEYAAGINESPAHGQIPLGERPGTADLQSSAKAGTRNNMA